MKIRNTTMLLFALVLLPVAAFAQYESDTSYGSGPSEVTFGVKGGWGWPQNDTLGETIENSWILGADVTWFFSDNWGLGLDARYSTKDFEEMADQMETMLDWSSMPISLNYYYRSSESNNSRFYAGAGLSMVYTSLDLDITGISETLYANIGTYSEGGTRSIDNPNAEIVLQDYSSSESEWGFGYNVVVGFQYSNFFLEGQYLYGSKEFPGFANYYGADGGLYGGDDDDASINVGTFNFVGGIRF